MRISDWSSDVCSSDLPFSVENDSTFLFPSLHLNFDATDRLKLRAAFISGAARPNFVNQRATVTINDAVGLQTVTGGNPALKPERAFGGDASVEWYFAPSSLLSASGFYRKEVGRASGRERVCQEC